MKPATPSLARLDPPRDAPCGALPDMGARPGLVRVDVVDRALQGCRRSWDVLVNAHHPTVVSYVRQRWPAVHARVGAEDVAQEGWVRLYGRVLAGLRGDKPRLTWLKLPGLAIRQVRFVALEILQTGRMKREELPEELPVIVDETARVEPRVAAREAFARLEALLPTLSAREREAWRLYYQEELTPPEIAARMGLGSPSAARMAISRARARLVAALGDAL